MTLEPTAYHHKLVNNEAGLIVSERLTLSPRFPVHIGEFNNREGLSRETEPLVSLARALDYAAALVAAERERCAMFCDELGKGLVENRRADDYERAFMEGGANALEMLSRALRVDFDLVEFKAEAIREGGEHG